jgi:hypothetical protein
VDWKAIDRVLGRSGNLQGEIYRVGFPRNDLDVRVGAVKVRPSLALGSWVAFKQTDDSTAMLMGDLVLPPVEVGEMPSSAAVSSRPLGLDTVQIARVLGVHGRANGGVYQISVEGDAIKVARGLRSALDEVDVKRD